MSTTVIQIDTLGMESVVHIHTLGHVSTWIDASFENFQLVLCLKPEKIDRQAFIVEKLNIESRAQALL